MRIVTIAAATLAGFLPGCAHDLPYDMSIDSQTKSGDCVLPLHEVVQTVEDSLTGKWSIREVQVRFEKEFAERVSQLKCQEPIARASMPETVSTKWIGSYGFQPTDPDENLDRFGEFLESSIFVKHLATKALAPDEDMRNTVLFFEHQHDIGSQWCGSPSTEDCRARRKLYQVITQPENLYQQLGELAAQITAKPNRTRRIVVLGYEIPWDAEKTFVRYGATFYFDDILWEDGSHRTTYLGSDLLYANEATPKPCVVENPEELPTRCAEKLDALSVPELTPGDQPWDPALKDKFGDQLKAVYFMTGYPFAVVIGLKNAVFEVVKAPFSFIAGALFGRDDAHRYPLQNFRTAYYALAVESTTQTRYGALWGVYRLITELPLVGQALQYNPGSDFFERDKLPAPSVRRRKLFLSRGIYGGNKWGQDTGLWAMAARQAYPTYDIYSPPYRHGTVTDVIWSMFNLSHGPAYSEVDYVMDHAGRKDRLYLSGHSGGVQRSASASRILMDHGYQVKKIVGIAGPSIGQAFVDSRYPDAFRVYLNISPGENQDVVSKVGLTAGAYSAVLDYAVVGTLKYTLGGLCIWSAPCREYVYYHANKTGFNNARVIEVERKPSSRHQTPLRLSLTNRLVFDAYVRSEFGTAFREDFERPSQPHATDRPHAFPWQE
ncbi:MAG: hypothetical protein ACT4OO_04445 [Nitrospiraceae bacterium]